MGSPASPERAAPVLRELSHTSPDLPEADPDASRDARYANPFAPPDELEPDGEPAPRSLFGEILDWMLAPLLLLWPGTARGSLRSAQWALLLLPWYFAEGLVRAASEVGRSALCAFTASLIALIALATGLAWIRTARRFPQELP